MSGPFILYPRGRQSVPRSFQPSIQNHITRKQQRQNLNLALIPSLGSSQGTETAAPEQGFVWVQAWEWGGLGRRDACLEEPVGLRGSKAWPGSEAGPGELWCGHHRFSGQPVAKSKL